MQMLGVAVAESCAPTKKACKNCSCGRSEVEEKEEEAKLTAAQIKNPTSACGSVSGKPAGVRCFSGFRLCSFFSCSI